MKGRGMASILLAVIALISGCAMNDMKWVQGNDVAVEPHDFAHDFYACRSANEYPLDKQVFITTERNYFTYKSPNVNVHGMEMCLVAKGWQHP